ncbi:MAG: Asp23/Gls24 family envelope stress response protein [Tissierellia bacterium]|nr:Asp23/Gls24 family envelope stress response protein [Tissierellia bacterium]
MEDKKYNDNQYVDPVEENKPDSLQPEAKAKPGDAEYLKDDVYAEKNSDATHPQDVDGGEGYRDSLTFNDSVVEKIVALAARDIQGVLDLKGGIISGLQESFNFGGGDETKGVDATVSDRDVILNVKMLLEFGQSAPRIFNELRKYASDQLQLMTGLNLVELNLEVVDVMTKKDFEEQKRKKQSSEANPPRQNPGYGPGPYPQNPMW